MLYNSIINVMYYGYRLESLCNLLIIILLLYIHTHTYMYIIWEGMRLVVIHNWCHKILSLLEVNEHVLYWAIKDASLGNYI